MMLLTMKFTTRIIRRKLMTGRQQLGMIKGALYGLVPMPNWVPTRLSVFIISSTYAASALDPSSRKDILDIKQLQDQAVQFIAGIKGRDGVE